MFAGGDLRGSHALTSSTHQHVRPVTLRGDLITAATTSSYQAACLQHNSLRARVRKPCKTVGYVTQSLRDQRGLPDI